MSGIGNRWDEIKHLYPQFCLSKEELQARQLDFQVRYTKVNEVAEVSNSNSFPYFNCQEIQIYARLVMVYVLARKYKDYELSDEIRTKLKEMNDWSDKEYEEMVETDVYKFHPFYESIEHTTKRLSER